MLAGVANILACCWATHFNLVLEPAVSSARLRPRLSRWGVAVGLGRAVVALGWVGSDGWSGFGEDLGSVVGRRRHWVDVE